MADTDQADLTTLTVELLSAYVANNLVPSSELADLIKTTRIALAGETVPETPPTREYPPAVSVRKSLGSRDHILSLIDGRPYKTLKRHLSGHGLSPAEYRDRYHLPKDYPMVAPAYSEHRRAVAQALGLGQRRLTKGAEAPRPTDTAASEPAIEAAAAASSPETKAPRVTKATRAAKAAKVSTAAAPEIAMKAAPTVEPKRRGRKPSATASVPSGATEAAPVEAAPKKRRRKPAAKAVPVPASPPPPRAKRQTAKALPVDVSPVAKPKGRRKAASA
jgi:predicted transcriptional regulator